MTRPTELQNVWAALSKNWRSSRGGANSATSSAYMRSGTTVPSRREEPKSGQVALINLSSPSKDRTKRVRLEGPTCQARASMLVWAADVPWAADPKYNAFDLKQKGIDRRLKWAPVIKRKALSLTTSSLQFLYTSCMQHVNEVRSWFTCWGFIICIDLSNQQDMKLLCTKNTCLEQRGPKRFKNRVESAVFKARNWGGQ